MTVRNSQLLRCIYCEAAPGKFSKEHYLPAALGRFMGFETLLDRVCPTCNTAFGKLEDEFLHGSLEGHYRAMQGITGRKKKGKRRHIPKVSPYRRGHAGSPPLELKAKLPGDDVEVLFEIDPETRMPRELRQIVLVYSDGEVRQYRVPERLRDPNEFRHMVEADYHGHIKEVRLFVDRDDEMPWLQSLAKAVVPHPSALKLIQPEPGRALFALTATGTSKYFRAIAKIGFHHFLKHVKGHRGDETRFAEIREFILKGGEPSKFVTWTTKPLTLSAHQKKPVRRTSHILVADADHLQLRSRLQFFYGPSLPRALVFTVDLGRNPTILHYNLTEAHFFTYYPGGSRNGFDGVMESANVINQRLLP